MILKTYNFNQESLYQIVSNKTKSRINTYIEELKEKGLLKGYFGLLAKNIYKRTRVKSSEILELFIYGAYIEEQSKLDKYEKQIMYDDVNYYYQEGQKQAKQKSKKDISILDMALFLYLLDQPVYNGFTFSQNIEVIARYNAEQIYKQCLINIQQGKENDIDDNIFQSIIKGQQNRKINIKENKVSGNMDLTLIGLNNKALIEGIKVFDKNPKVQFISDLCDHVTPMCNGMHNMIFNVNDYNEFIRFIGTSIKDVRQEKIKIFGLVPGINEPPINNFFHWCHSYLVYVKK